MSLVVQSEANKVVTIPLHPGARLYLDLLKRCLTRVAFPDRAWLPDLSGTTDFSLELRADGRDWPTEAETMIGLRRLDNLEKCIGSVLSSGVPGDLVETGVWRGGASIFMRGVLKAYGDESRSVWVCDSFSGLPKPDEDRYPDDHGDAHHRLAPYLAVSLSEVQNNFRRYELLDSRVNFVQGWFRDTLPSASVSRIAVLRLDGDMYESTMEALVNLYHRVSVGGYVIVDDYGALPNCRKAIADFRYAQSITDPIEWVDWTGVYWRKR